MGNNIVQVVGGCCAIFTAIFLGIGYVAYDKVQELPWEAQKTIYLGLLVVVLVPVISLSICQVLDWLDAR